jgi:hypothetical protein
MRIAGIPREAEPITLLDFTSVINKPRRGNLWVTGTFRIAPEHQPMRAAKTMPDSRAALSLFVASFLCQNPFTSPRLKCGKCSRLRSINSSAPQA